MPGPRERDIRTAVDELKTATPSDIDVTVEWRDAAPEERPDGIGWDAETGTLGYDVWSAQRTCLDVLTAADHDIVAFLAGYGSGKSELGARWLIAQALAHPGTRVLAMGISFQKARTSTYPKLFKNLPGERTDLVTTAYNGPETSPIVTDYNRSEHRLTLVNDSEIVLGSADSWNRYAGAEFGAIWMDEPSHYGEVLHDLTGMMTTRLRGMSGPRLMFWTLTGEGYNPAWEILEQRQDGDGNPIGLDIHVETASVLDNPYLSDGEKARFRRKYEGTEQAEQALHGGFAAATGLVYSNFSRDTHVIPAEEARDRVEDDWRLYGYDAGWNDPRVLLEIGRTAYDQLVVLDEFYRSGCHVEDAIAWLGREAKPDGVIYAEHVPAEIRKFERAGWDVEKAEKDIDAGVAEVRRRLDADGNLSVDTSNGSVSPEDAFLFEMNRRTGATTVHSSNTSGDTEESPDPEHGTRVGLLIAAHCSNLTREFLGYKEDHVGKATATDHALDALRYVVMGAGGSGRGTE